MKASKPIAVSVAPGYDNQPSFNPDGHRILFAANRDGKQSDVYQFDRRTNQTTQLTRTTENENSPTYLPAGIGDAGGFSVVQTEPDRTQRLWRFNAQGANPQLVLAEIKPVGYHAWIGPEQLVLLVLGPPSTLQIADANTGKAAIVADNIGRSLHRIPGTRFASFVHREASGDYWIKQLDVSTKKIDPLVKVVEGNSERDMTWMPDGKTILMSAGTKVFSWTGGGGGLDRSIRRRVTPARRDLAAQRVTDGRCRRYRGGGTEKIGTTHRRHASAVTISARAINIAPE